MNTITTLSHTIINILIVMSILCMSPLVFAENSKISEETRQERADVREIRKENGRVYLSENLHIRIANLEQNVTNRLNAVIERYSNIVTRIDTRIAKLEVNGIDTTASKNKLTEAKMLLDDAHARLKSRTHITEALSSETPKELFAIAREEVIVIRQILRETHSTLLETVSLLKEAVTQSDGYGVDDAVSQSKNKEDEIEKKTE